MLKTIKYSLTFLGEMEVEDDVELTYEELRDYLMNEYQLGLDIEDVNDIEWEEVR